MEKFHAVSPLADQPLLTVAIPTWNRGRYLAENLAQLAAELRGVPPGKVEVLVSDNCSPDDTGAVVERARAAGLPVQYVRNEKNLGWALNFAQAFDLSQGRYVLLMGDDDLFVDGALGLLLDRLATGRYGVVCLRPYGYDEDFRREFPGGRGRERVFQDANDFLVATSKYFTLTSALVLDRTRLQGVETRQFISTDLATFHLLLRAALASPENLFIDRYLVASKRQNSASYEYARIFVGQLWQIIDAHRPFGLREATIRRLERDKIFSYYPFYLFDQRLARRGNLAEARALLDARFHGRWLYKLWLAPIIWLPRSLALVWGAGTTAIGRVLGGDLRRGLMFAWSRLGRRRG